jgi:sialate O-acetylesterase
MRNRIAVVAVLTLAGWALTGVCLGVTPAEGIKPHSLFTDNMVLQRGIDVPVWGTAKPGGRITIRISDRSVCCDADARGNWMAKVPPMKAGGPYELVISGKETISLKNVLVGDVWICSGQSNMEQGIGACLNPKEEIAAANYPQIRLFMVPRRIANRPEKTVDASWKVCTSENVAAGGWAGFSGAAYYFGRHLHKELKVPIGLIQTCWGGTVAEAWTSAEALSTMEDFKPAVTYMTSTPEGQKKLVEAFEKQMVEWWRKQDRNWDDPKTDVSGWKTMKLPQNWERAGIEAMAGFDGLVWFRRDVDIPAAWAGKDLKLELGPVDDRDRTMFNGVKIGGMNYWRTPRAYTVPGKLVKAGRNVISVRVLDTGGGGGIYRGPQRIGLAAGGGKTIPLSGPWSYKVAAPLAELKMPQEPPRARGANTVTVLYNGMIAPLLPCGIKGAIWYQGESNSGRPLQYRTLLPTMIEDWRSRFGVGKFPFFIVQLANFTRVQTQPAEGGWALLREAQLLTALKDPMAGLAVITDIGDARDIHPKDKQGVGRRLALSALAIAYGRDLVHSGPVYRGMNVEGGKVRLAFDHVGGGLVAKGDTKLKGFAIAGEDKEFVWADAVIDGKTVVVSSPKVAKPAAVRYNWASNPIGNLFNKEGLPASSFRTDFE